MGDGRQLRAAPEPDVDVVLRDGGELALPAVDEPVPTLGDEFLAVAAAAAAATIPATPVAAPFIFPIVPTGPTATTTAAAIATTAATIAGVTFDVGFVYGDPVASPRATLLSPSTRRQSYRQ